MIPRFLSLLLLSGVAVAGAVNTTKLGVMELSPTFHNIGVKCWFTNDDNFNATATLQYRETGSETYLSAYAPYVDRRQELVVSGTPNVNTFSNQIRGSIIGVLPNTSYDVLLTVSDPDGIAGSATVSGTVTTLSFIPPTNGVIRHINASAGSEGTGTEVSPFKTITNAIEQSTAGDTLMAAPGTYAAMTITKPGTSAGWFVLRTNGAGDVTIDGGAVANSVHVAASYWLLHGLKFTRSQKASIQISNGINFVQVQFCREANGVSLTNEFTGVAAFGNGTNQYLLTNWFATANEGITNNNDGFLNNVDLGGFGRNCVIMGNVLQGGWDGIGGRVNSFMVGNGENSDIVGNIITNAIDDAIEADGFGPNLRVYNNKIWKRQGGSGGYGGSLFSDAGTQIGPNYYVRNLGLADCGAASSVGLKIGAYQSIGWALYAHNTFITTNGSSNEIDSELGYGTGGSSNKFFLNNIWQAAGNIYYHGGANNTHNYNLAWNPTKVYAYQWGGTTDYDTFTDFKTGTGQELNGLNADPLFASSAFDLSTTSPAKDAGLALDGINTPGSLWPMVNGAADIGAFEFGSDPAGEGTTGTRRGRLNPKIKIRP